MLREAKIKKNRVRRNMSENKNYETVLCPRFTGLKMSVFELVQPRFQNIDYCNASLHDSE